jgi:hypothetical protein
MDAFNKSILRFVLDWTPYGGPQDDAASREFGLSADAVLNHFATIVVAAARETRLYGSADRELLLRAWTVHKSMCRQVATSVPKKGQL